MQNTCHSVRTATILKLLSSATHKSINNDNCLASVFMKKHDFKISVMTCVVYSEQQPATKRH